MKKTCDASPLGFCLKPAFKEKTWPVIQLTNLEHEYRMRLLIEHWNYCRSLVEVPCWLKPILSFNSLFFQFDCYFYFDKALPIGFTLSYFESFSSFLETFISYGKVWHSMNI
ncbi:unnamed protein product [Ranitomeya imitator]|uniref:Maturase K n=1 Tax=Ranitomeya imitator TaxID=111125 RepID=A0ABN9LU23_9NEOB|nr:unnamed protein product [Ranitomeya imitator]